MEGNGRIWYEALVEGNERIRYEALVECNGRICNDEGHWWKVMEGSATTRGTGGR